jgi:hypothetical protein
MSNSGLGSVDGFPFVFPQPDLTDYILAYNWPYGGKIAQLNIGCSFGSGLVSVLINGVVVTGLDHVPVASNARGEHNATDLNSFFPGDDIVLRIESGPPGLLNVVGTLVVTNRSLFSQEELPFGFQTGQIPIVGALVGALQIPLIISPPLRRNPSFKWQADCIKTLPTEASIYSVAMVPFVAGDFTGGWNYVLNAAAIAGQVLEYAYVI